MRKLTWRMSKYRDTRRIDMIVIHCSATPNGKHFTAEQIDDWHAARNFKRDPELAKHSNLKHVGYHLINYISGVAVRGRLDRETGAHAAGYNSRSISICMIGTDRFSVEQWQLLHRRVDLLRDRFPNIKRIVGHRDLSVDLNEDGVITSDEWCKTCPGFDVATWLANDMQPLPEWVYERAAHD
jgi:hypothetical protein